MTGSNLSAVVIGAGWAGEGHTKALQLQGVRVEAICARNIEAVEKAARDLGVGVASINWKRTLLELKPDIVALATPASLRKEVIALATEMDCHLFVDKPLAIDTKEAQQNFKMVKSAKLKHAFAATHCYDPGLAWIGELLEKGSIGELREIEIVCNLPHMKRLTPWTWFDSLRTGGGALNNGLTHFLGMLERLLQGKLITIMGQSQTFRNKAPVRSDIHDYRTIANNEHTLEVEEPSEWKTCDADTGFHALCKFRAGLQHKDMEVPVSIKFDLFAVTTSPANGWYFYGDEGILVANGTFSLQVGNYEDTKVVPLPIPERFYDTLPTKGNDEQDKWNALARDFVADIKGGPSMPYLTLEDGWRYQLAIDAVRKGVLYEV
ncbi:MAG: Gfo/Idh/MocA family oxidoreductase [Saonia sp.]